MTIEFSELLKTFKELNQRRLSESFVDISYLSNVDNRCSSIRPAMKGWFVTRFESDKLQVFLNFTNPLYVSSSDISDEINIKVEMNYVFQS